MYYSTFSVQFNGMHGHSTVVQRAFISDIQAESALLFWHYIILLPEVLLKEYKVNEMIRINS